MDIASIIGLLFGVGLLVSAIMMAEGATFGDFR